MYCVYVLFGAQEGFRYEGSDPAKVKAFVMNNIDPTMKVRIYYDDVLLPGGRYALDVII